jgi:pyridoxamine 5'-phosphate oxidase
MLTPKDFAHTRFEYFSKPLLEEDAGLDPFALFHRWMADALSESVPEPNAMTLATVDAQNRPSARIVLMKAFDERGLSFFTSYIGRKAKELGGNNHAAAVFFWEPMHRQIRIAGSVTRTSREESDAYFQSRPRDSRLAAWSAEQSSVLESRESLQRAFEEMKRRFGDGPIPTPETWGGFLLRPDVFEFWQGRENRLHDRLRFQRDGNGWRRERLAP